MLHTTIARGWAALLLLGSSSCTLLTDVELTPCDPDEDDPCPEDFICDAEESVCIGSECTNNAGCNSQSTDEALFACIEGACVQPMCEQDSDCQDHGDGFGNSVCEDELCVPGQCERDAECKEELDTEDAVCMKGRCEDPIWGCIGRKDPREAEGDSASFKIELVDAVSIETHPAEIEAEACPKIDRNCNSAFSTNSTYNEKNGMLTVEGLPQDFGGFLRITGTSPGGAEYMEGRFFFENRTAINEYDTPGGAVMLLGALVPTLGEMGGVDADIERGLLLGRVFNCQDELAEGVTLVVNDPGLADDAVIFYTDEANAPTQDLAETTAAGTIGIANILKEEETPDRVIDMEAYIGNQKITDLTVIIEPGALTHAFIYPGYE